MCFDHDNESIVTPNNFEWVTSCKGSLCGLLVHVYRKCTKSVLFVIHGYSHFRMFNSKYPFWLDALLPCVDPTRNGDGLFLIEGFYRFKGKKCTK